MKKISLLFVMLLAFTISTTAQSLPKPAMPELTEFIDYGMDDPISPGINLGYTITEDFDGNLVGDDYTLDKYFAGEDYSILDPSKVYFSIFTDNDQIFTFTPELFPDAPIQVTYPMTQFPYSGRQPNGSIGYWDIHIKASNLVENESDRLFNWRIGIQTIYIDGEETSYSDIYYMEVYPQLQEAKNVTSTSFLADWICNEENTFIINNFYGEGCGYFLYVIDKATQEVVLTQNVAPTNYAFDEWGNEYPLPGATYTVEGLTPGKTYQFYVVVKQNTGMAYQSVVREVTLPETVYMLGGDDQNWDCTKGTEFEYNAENNNYTATINFPAEFNYFGFTTRLAENNDDGGWAYIEPYRFGAVADENTDFWYSDELNGQPINMTWDAYHAVRIASGEYKLTVDLANMTLVIEKIEPEHGYDLGDVNHDHAVNIADVTVLIDYLLGTGTVCQICADVNGDKAINIADVTALIDVLLTGN
ncbi:MAG: hypothetical protein IKW97_05780 [Muribaculaceae bacterium]|nr:hypothetical protein [Muribaculaceae bacterium]